MSKHPGNYVYPALILAITAALLSSPQTDGLYERVSQMMLTNSGMEAGFDMNAGAEIPERQVP